MLNLEKNSVIETESLQLTTPNKDNYKKIIKENYVIETVILQQITIQNSTKITDLKQKMMKILLQTL